MVVKFVKTSDSVESSFHAHTETPLHEEAILCAAELDETCWSSLEQSHQDKIDAWMIPELDRRSRNEPDPIVDFLFEYYCFRPSHLRRWSPGLGVFLQGSNSERFLSHEGFSRQKEGVTLDPRKFPDKLHRSTRWIRDLLVSTRDRAPHLGCSGMHEWAMVYGNEPVRHAHTPLRLERESINKIVEESVLSCTHYDAFRFYTPAARPLNALQLDRTNMADNEQPGCLHANMDLYRWASKRSPWIPSELVADSFFLAIAIRQVDMRASPYDLSKWGIQPIRVETPEGKRDYLSHQKQFMDQAAPLRSKLIAAYDALVEAIELQS